MCYPLNQYVNNTAMHLFMYKTNKLTNFTVEYFVHYTGGQNVDHIIPWFYQIYMYSVLLHIHLIIN